MFMSSVDFWSSPDDPAVFSLRKIPGAMQLTRIFASVNVVAIIRVRWMKPYYVSLRQKANIIGEQLTSIGCRICKLTAATTFHDP